MKKKVLLGLAVSSVMLLAACNPASQPAVDPVEQQIRSIYEMYRSSTENPKSYEEWLASIKGQDGQDGQDGQPGHTPVITIDPTTGNWLVDGVDTGVHAQGEKGEDGKDGQDGQPGQNGQNGQDGQDGHTPVITIDPTTGNWLVDGVDTGVHAQGEKGEDGKDGQDGQDGQNGQNGQNGQDGHTPVITIDPTTGNWCVDGVDTGVHAQGEKGEDGKDGQDGQNGQNGQDGQDGQDGENGKSAYELWCEKHPEYEGTEEEWLHALANGELADKNEHVVTFRTLYNDATKTFNADVWNFDAEVTMTPLADGMVQTDTNEYMMVVEDGKRVPRPVNPVLAGYSFKGWLVEGKFGGTSTSYYEPYSFMNATVIDDTKLFASWEANQYTYTLKDGEDVVKTEAVKYGSPLELPKLASGAKGVFAGWADEAGNLVGSRYEFTKDMIFQAQYSALPEDLPGTYYSDDESISVEVKAAGTEVVVTSSTGYSTKVLDYTIVSAENDNAKLVYEVTDDSGRVHTLEMSKDGDEWFCKAYYLYGTSKMYDFGGSNGFNVSKPRLVTSVTLKANKTAVKTTEKVTLTATFNPTNAFSAYKVLTVNCDAEAFDVDGLVLTAKKAGTFEVTVTACNDSEEHKVTSNKVTITVTQPVHVGEIKVSDMRLVVGNSGQLQYELVSESEGKAITEKNITVESLDTSVFTVAKDGKTVKALKAGEAKVRVSDSISGVSGEATVKVLAKEMPAGVAVTDAPISANCYGSYDAEVATITLRADGTGTVTIDDAVFDLTLVDYEENTFYMGPATDLDTLSCTVVLNDDGSVVVKDLVDSEECFSFEESYTVKEATPLTYTLSIDASNCEKEFTVGDEFNHDGLVATWTSSLGDSEDVSFKVTVSSPDMSTAGEKTVTVSYEGESCTYKITVSEPKEPEGEAVLNDGNYVCEIYGGDYYLEIADGVVSLNDFVGDLVDNEDGTYSVACDWSDDAITLIPQADGSVVVILTEKDEVYSALENWDDNTPYTFEVED